MKQWVEEKDEKGDCEYKMEWSDKIIDSDDYMDYEHSNP